MSTDPKDMTIRELQELLKKNTIGKSMTYVISFDNTDNVTVTRSRKRFHKLPLDEALLSIDDEARERMFDEGLHLTPIQKLRRDILFKNAGSKYKLSVLQKDRLYWWEKDMSKHALEYNLGEKLEKAGIAFRNKTSWKDASVYPQYSTYVVPYYIDDFMWSIYENSITKVKQAKKLFESLE